MKTPGPDYKKIYTDILHFKYPHKQKVCESLLSKKQLSFFDIIKINELIFGSANKETSVLNHMHRSYSREAVVKILEYQAKYQLTNSQIALHFSLSRNSIARWRKNFKNIKQ
ncbi:hypothetical protein HNP38_001190 [Chryseobacterium defluvii]|uniref:Transposase n=1 Tax=Chryseobacterium defluvii TaxID=160396 RepID=A0A840KD40_9FLAO|nr:helix-turn-helix domain-containing protein [Chryseobacterium defluvii]MBB4805918.1 hypothetical protein [Chryseobacterium defluvii]